LSFLRTEACSQMHGRTPYICAMQQDNSDDLQAIGSILHNVAGDWGNLYCSATLMTLAF